MSKTTVGNVLGTLMQDMSESLLAKKINIPKATINRILSGRTPDPRVHTLTPIAQYFGISIEQLLGLAPLPNKDKVSDIPKGNFYTLPFIEFNKIYEWQLKQYKPEKNYRITSMRDDLLNQSCYITKPNTQSMMPKFQNNTFLIVDLDSQANSDDFVIYFSSIDNSIYFRQLINEGNDLYLCAVHPGFEVIKVTSDFIFLGVVIESRMFLK